MAMIMQVFQSGMYCYTKKGNKLYAHVFEAPIGPWRLPESIKIVSLVRRLADGSEIKRGESWVTNEYKDIPLSAWASYLTSVTLCRMIPIPFWKSH